MPIKKGKAKAKNLGAFAVKRKNADSESDDEHTKKKKPRMAPPDVNSSDEDCATRGTFDANIDTESDPEGDEDESDLEIEEDDDVPHHKDTADLQKWLKLSDQHLAALHTSAAPTRHGNYHSSKVGQGVSKRRQQALKKEEKERSAREQKEDLLRGVKPTKIQDFFSRASCAPPVVPASKPTIELLDIERFEPMDIDSPSKLATEEPEMGGNVVDEASDLDLDLAPSPEPLSTSPLHRVTVEDVDDEEDDFISVEPCQLSPEAMAEEGLDELPWDPSEEILPWQIDSPAIPASEPANPAGPTAPVHLHNTPASSSTSQANLPPPMEPVRSNYTPASSSTSPTCFPHERGFVMPDRPDRRKLPSAEMPFVYSSRPTGPSIQWRECAPDAGNISISIFYTSHSSMAIHAFCYDCYSTPVTAAHYLFASSKLSPHPI
ncbi:hypothetical protein B0H14DRAFT_2570114 [Mycena olivaceomarginata]|nr:hypothetical protein B0H14DRAFT_2570114 [Mycena olivaceomarginata]